MLGCLDGQGTLLDAITRAEAELGVAPAEREGFTTTALRMAHTLYRLGFLLRNGDPVH